MPVLRSTPVAAALYLASAAGRVNDAGVAAGSSGISTRAPGFTTRVWLPLPAPSQVLPAACTEATVASCRVFRLSRKQPGLPVYTAHSASASALPPKPPMRSTPRTQPAWVVVRARSSSSWLGPSFSNALISSSIAASTLATSTPCFTDAMTMKLLPSCEP